MKNRIVLESTELNSSKKNVFNLLKQIETLKYIASPYAKFTVLGKEESLLWEEGEEISFELKIFNFIPMKKHKIKVIEFSEERIYTNESNPYVHIWNHKITLEKISEDRVKYTDEVEINAGWRTMFVYIWAKLFYRHRQRKWKNLLEMK